MLTVTDVVRYLSQFLARRSIKVVQPEPVALAATAERIGIDTSATGDRRRKHSLRAVLSSCSRRRASRALSAWRMTWRTRCQSSGRTRSTDAERKIPDDLRNTLNRLHGLPVGEAYDVSQSGSTDAAYRHRLYRDTPEASISDTARDISNRFLGAHLLEYRYSMPALYEAPSKKTIWRSTNRSLAENRDPGYGGTTGSNRKWCVNCFWQDLMEIKKKLIASSCAQNGGILRQVNGPRPE